MEPMEKGLKVADGKIAGEKLIFKKTSEGFGVANQTLSTYDGTQRKFKLNFEDDKVRRGGGLNRDIDQVFSRRKISSDRANTLAKIKSSKMTSGHGAGETRKAMLL